MTARLRQCCCGCSLKEGTIVIAVICLVSGTTVSLHERGFCYWHADDCHSAEHWQSTAAFKAQCLFYWSITCFSITNNSVCCVPNVRHVLHVTLEIRINTFINNVFVFVLEHGQKQFTVRYELNRWVWCVGTSCFEKSVPWFRRQIRDIIAEVLFRSWVSSCDICRRKLADVQFSLQVLRFSPLKIFFANFS
jgi:hypothetical protein